MYIELHMYTNKKMYEDEKLIELVRKNPCLYNFNHPRYRDSEYKTNVWDSIGEEMGRTGRKCKTRFISLRDQFKKNLRKSTERSSTRRWKYQEELSFIIPFTREKKKSKERTVMVFKDDSHLDMQDNQYIEPELVDIDTKSNLDLDTKSEPNSDSNENPSPKLEDNPMFGKIFSLYSKPKTEAEEKHPDPDPLDSFFTNIISTVKRFSPYYQNIAKSRIFSVVSELELKQILEGQQPSTSTSTQNNGADPLLIELHDMK